MCFSEMPVSCQGVHMTFTVVLGKQGRMIIPAQLRAALELTAGGRDH